MPNYGSSTSEDRIFCARDFRIKTQDFRTVGVVWFRTYKFLLSSVLKLLGHLERLSFNPEIDYFQLCKEIWMESKARRTKDNRYENTVNGFIDCSSERRVGSESNKTRERKKK